MILYLHQHPAIKPNEIITKRSFSPIPMDDGKCGYYGDRIFNAHNSASRFYVALVTPNPGKKTTRMNDK